MPLSSGTRLDFYEVTGKLGEGAMGEVYRARDTTLDRDVALKVLPEAFTADPERLARFQREAKVLASLNHPNIGGIHGLQTSGDTRALVLELIEGPTLAERIAEGPVPVDQAVAIVRQIADALSAAHDAGIVHRDLKPANIKVRADGTVKVLDFGLAKAAEGVGGETADAPTMTAMSSQAGAIIGTAAYMPPEQARGQVVDKRADIWALGCVCYELLTGRRAFEGGTISDTLASVLAREVDLTHLPDSVPPALQKFIGRCLEKDATRRLRDAAEGVLQLDEGLAQPVVETAEAPAVAAAVPLRPWQRPLPALATAVALTALTGLAVWTMTRPEPLPTAPVARFAVPLGADQSFTRTGRHVVAISPDGSAIVYVANSQLFVRRLDQLQATAIPGTQSDSRSPFISPDGEWIGFFADGQLKKVAMSGGAPVTLCDAQNPWGASWGADDMILFGQGPEGIWRVPGTSGTPEVVITVEDGEQAHGPQMLPGNEWVLFTLSVAGSGAWDDAQVVMQSVVTGERVVLIEGGRDARYVETEHLVYALNGVLFALAFDLDARAVLGGPVPLLEGVQDTNATGAAQFSVARNGSLVYVPGSAGGGGNVSSLVWLNRSGDAEAIPAPPRAYSTPRVSPDGTRVAVAITTGDGSDVWIWNLERETLTQLTFGEGSNSVPLWTPDSTRIVFHSHRDGPGMYWKAADGTGQVERLSQGEALPYAWSADGRLIFEQEQDIGALTMEGERTVEMLLDGDFQESAPALSPDGRWLAYMSNETGDTLTYVQPYPNIDDGQWRVSPVAGGYPVWSPDGRELFYLGPPTPNLMSVRVETEPTFSARTPELLFGLSGYTLFQNSRRQFDGAPGGDRFVLLEPGVSRQTGDRDALIGMVVVENWFEELKERVPIP